MTNIIQLKHAAKIHGCENIVAEVVTITPPMATAWLRCNQKNRPVRKKHIVFLAGEITSGNWQVNGQAIVIAENENVLDGQHRLLAIIEAGQPIQSLVVYGIDERAFSTIDTGAVRTGADALSLHFNDFANGTVKAVATAVQWLAFLERGMIYSGRKKLSNTDVVEYAKEHQHVFGRIETLQSYPKDNRPLSLGVGGALYEMFARKDEEKADEFMKAIYTGEGLQRKDVEYVLRQWIQKDAQRTTAKFPVGIKARMAIKAWNWRRRGMPEASQRTLAVSATDDLRVTIL